MRKIVGLTVLAAVLAATTVPVMGAIREHEAEGPALEIAGSYRGTEAASAAAGEPEEETEAAVNTSVWDGDVNSLDCAEEATQLIVVVSDESDPAGSSFSWYRRGDDGRLALAMEENAFCVTGMNGVSLEKKEGDKKTPQGVFRFSGAFGLKRNPGTILPYHHLISGDYYVDDPESRYYNRLVNVFNVRKDWNSAEDLMAQVPHYNYALIIDYNAECVPGRGSAIFLHCPKYTNNTGTSGCVSIPEEKMLEVVKGVDEGTRILIVRNREELSKY